MKITKALIEKLTRLEKGDVLPASSLKGDWVDQMQADGILLTITHGSHKSIRVTDSISFRHYLASQYDIFDLERTHDLLLKDDIDRALLVDVTGNSKFLPHRTFTGFLVNSYQPIGAMLSGRALTILPPDGTFLFISDYKHFSIPEDVVIVGVENAENFRYVSRQKYLFDGFNKVIFVSRYPQEQSKDLLQWLSSIPNKYVHFGDFDLAGINIFITEFYRHLGDRASFLIPSDIELRLKNGSSKRYNDQLARFKDLSSDNSEIQSLIDMINTFHRGYDQEGYIMSSKQ